MNSERKVRIGNRFIGDKEPVFVIAEIGINHNGSVEIAKKMADALEVSLDYLTGSTNFVIQDKKMLYRLELLQKIAQPERDRILLVMDSLLRDAQINLTQQKLA